MFNQVLKLSEELDRVREANLRLRSDFTHALRINDSLIEDNELLQKKLDQTESLWKATAQTLQTEIDQLRAELADERDRHDRLQDFEVAESKQLAEAKQEAKKWQDRFETALKLLKIDGYNVSGLVAQIAVHRTLKEFGGKSE